MSAILLGVFIFVIGFVILALKTSGSEPPRDSGITASLAQKDSPCETGEGQTGCWNSFYGTLSKKRGTKVALADLKARYRDQGYARSYCHPLLHIVGQRGFEEYGSLGEAFLHGDTFCRSGYYHGVMEGMFLTDGSDRFLSRLDAICESIPGKSRYSYDYFSCVHGIGHGLMAYFYHDLFASLKACNNLSHEWEQGSCYGGAFMENIISDAPETPSKFLEAEDPLYPCNVVKDKYRYQCYLMQTSYMLTVLNGDFTEVFQLCAEVDEKYRVTCYQSLGRDASGWSSGSVHSARLYCALGLNEEQRANCLVGAAIDFLQSSGRERARQLCESAPEGEGKICSTALEEAIKAE